MNKVSKFKYAERFCKENCIVVVKGKDGKVNPITIGWKTLGILWSTNIVTIAVRPSRFSFKILNSGIQGFTVNFMKPEHQDAIDYCGSKSGRNTDKIAGGNLTLADPIKGKVPFLQEADLVYECKIIHTAESGDITPHRLYFGEILGAFSSL